MPENTVTIVGNVTDDPELRFTQGGSAVVNFTVACNSRFKNDAGEWEDKLQGFFRCSAWRDMAENISESITKGMRVVVTGKLEQKSWETDDGKRSMVEVQVDDIGPSLKWSTATVEKANRGNKSGGGSWG